jgi:hypothetical protein
MSRRTTRSLVSAAVLAVAGTLAAPALAADVETRVTIRNGPPAFHGVVKSANEKCVELRMVKLYKQKNSGDVLKGKDAANSEGKWHVPVTPKNGAYYAKVSRFEDGSLTCLKDRSRTVHVD